MVCLKIFPLRPVFVRYFFPTAGPPQPRSLPLQLLYQTPAQPNMSQPSSLAEKGHSSHVEHEDDNARALDVLYKSKAYKRGLLKVDVCVTGVCMLLYLFS